MSKFYEVKRRDGAARLGKLLLDEERETPLLINLSREADKKISRFVYHPEDEGVFEGLLKEEETPRGTLLLPDIHPLAPKMKEVLPSLKVDFFILSFSSDMLKNPSNFVRRIIDARNSIPPDVALWVPGVATPENISILIYAGVDVIDNANAIIKGYQGIYQTEEGEMRIGEIEELPCNCKICSSLDAKDLRGEEQGLLIAEHNTLLLEKELRKVKGFIRRGNLREYVEMRVRSSAFLTAALRLMDNEEEYFERRTPVARRSGIRVNTMESLRRVEVRRFARRIKERYKPPKRKILLMLPCSARKPYSTSPSHLKFIEAIRDWRGYIHEIILTSPLGVVPRELEAVYPASFYDIPVTGYWDEEEKKWVIACLVDYLRRNYRNYEVIIAHVEGAYREICKRAAEEVGVEVLFSCEDEEKVASREALRKLRACVSEICEGKKKLSELEKRRCMIKAVADYQFGVNAGNELLGGEDRLRITGRYPYYEISSDMGRLARFMPEYGLLALTLRGARKIEKLGTYKIRIDNFVPKNSIFAPGVIDADPQIRENDEVIFVGDKAFGVGRARMSGWEMVMSRKGVAVDVREVEGI
ncbi:MAG: archaeosine synthase subunit alpha [Candidatus Methanospirareceae archaeon]